MVNNDMRGNERYDHQAWLDWAAYGHRFRRDGKVRIKLEDWKEAGSRSSESVLTARKSDDRPVIFDAGDVEPRRKKRRSKLTTYQIRLSRAVTGKDDPEFVLADLGYTVDELRTHLERQFLPRMTWENYAGNLPFKSKTRKWHIDHIMPKANFCYDELVSAFSLSNLRPLWEFDNMRKGRKRVHLL